jgi:hypothetical protein
MRQKKIDFFFQNFGLFFPQNIHVLNGLWNIICYSFQIFTFVQNCTPKEGKAKHDFFICCFLGEKFGTNLEKRNWWHIPCVIFGENKNKM